MVKMSIIIWPQDRHWARSWSENMMPGLFLRMLQGVRWFREEPSCLIWVILHINWYLYLLRIEWVYNFNWVSDLSRFSIPRSLATPGDTCSSCAEPECQFYLDFILQCSDTRIPAEYFCTLGAGPPPAHQHGGNPKQSRSSIPPLKYWLVTHKVRPLPRPPPPGVLPGARVREPAGLKIRYDMTMTDMYILYQAGI